jgi:excisionase family DNA binding protein
MFSTREAAAQLNVSVRRVNALIASGDLQAEKFGDVWAIDEQSVERLASNRRPAGRPRRDQKDPDLLDSYTLMNKNHAVLEFIFNRQRGIVVSLETLKDVAYAPPGACGRPGRPTPTALTGWIRDRYIPSVRPNLNKVLKELGLTQASELLFSSLGLNLSDQYWFRPAGSSLNWHEVNYFENDYTDILGRSLNNQQVVLTRHNVASPSSGTPGVLPKWWERREGRNYLVKAGGYSNREPFNEVLASELYAVLLDEDDYASYWLEEVDGRAFSVCACMVDANTELIPLRDALSCYAGSDVRSIYERYLRVGEELEAPGLECHLAKMLACDFLTANPDRHDLNLGLIRDVESLTYLGAAPIFDNGHAFYLAAYRPDELKRGLYQYESNPFSPYPLSQLALISDYDWYDPSRLTGFDDTIRRVLGQHPNLSEEWIEAIVAQFAYRLARLNEQAAQFRPLSIGGR